jgi:glutaredoxin
MLATFFPFANPLPNLYHVSSGYGKIVVADMPYGVIALDKAKHSAATQVRFYTKAGCHLCDEARDKLEDIAAQTEYELTEIDIRSDPEIFEQYRFRIPVIIIDDSTLLEGRIDYGDLSQAFHLD